MTTSVVRLPMCGSSGDIVRIHRPSRWGNPYKIGDQHPDVEFTCPMNRDHVIALFRRYAIERREREPGWLEPLRGKRLACWCAPLPCHGDVIAELLEATS